MIKSRRYKILLTLVFTFFFVITCDDAPIIELYSISGQVLNEQGQGLEGAAVTISRTGLDLSVKTTSAGNFEFEDMFEGNYDITAEKDGFIRSTPRSITLDNGTLEVEDILLQRLGSLFGTVRDFEGNLIEEALIEVIDTDITTQTNEAGAYTLVDLDAGSFKLLATKEGFDGEIRDITVEHGDNREVNFVVAKKPSIVGRIVHKITLLPISGAKIELLDAGLDPVTDQRTNDEGGFQFLNLNSGNYNIKVEEDDFLIYEVAVELESREELEFLIELTPEVPPGSISGKLTNELNGAPVEGAKVTVTSADGTVEKSTFSIKTGDFLVESLMADTYTFEVQKVGYEKEIFEIELAEAENSVQSLGLSPFATIIVAVVNQQALSPLNGASITVNGLENDIKETGPDGTYVFEDLTEGNYSLKIKKDGFVTTTVSILLHKGEIINKVIPLEPFAPILNTDVELGYFEKDVTLQQIKIINEGMGDLIWSIENEIPWLNIAPIDQRGTNTVNDPIKLVTLSVDRKSLGHGSHTEFFSIKSNGGDINVKVTVEVVTKLCIDQDILNFNLLNTGNNSNTRILRVQNCGSGKASYTIEKNRNWIKVDPKTGSISNGADEITVEVDRESLLPGNYNGKIEFISAGGIQEIYVQMSVPSEGNSQLTLSTNLLDFGNNIIEREITVFNTGNTNLTWGVVPQQNWLSIKHNTQGGTLAEGESKTITVVVNRSNLPPDSYHGRLEFRTPQKVIDVEVLMNIASNAILSVDPENLSFGTETTQLNILVDNAGSGELDWTIRSNNTWIDHDLTDQLNTGSKVVTISVYRELLDIGSASGSLTIESNGGDLDITVTAIKSGPPPRIILKSAVLISDEDGNGEPNPGERLEYDITVENESNFSNAFDVRATLTSMGNYIQLNEGNTINFNNIGINETRTQKIILQVADEVPLGEDALIVLDITDQDQRAWKDEFEVKLKPFIHVKGGLTTYYNFDNGEVVDLITEERGTAFEGAETSLDSPLQEGFSYEFFREKGSFINLGKNKLQDYGQEATINLWIKFKSDGKRMNLIHASDRSDEEQILAITKKKEVYIPDFEFDNDLEETSLFDGNWHMLTVVFAETSRVYIDTEFFTEEKVRAHTLSDFGNISKGMVLGKRTEVSDSFFDGFMDNIRFYNRVLTLDEIQQIFSLKL